MLTTCKEELPNPYKNCIRELLNSLACYSNSYQRLVVEIKNLEQEHKVNMDKVVFPCSEIRKLRICMSKERMKEFENNINNIDEITECFKKCFDEKLNQRNKILEEAQMCLKHFLSEKEKLKKFHEKTIHHLKCVRVQSDDPTVINNCENDIHELNKRFVREAAYIKKCEETLQPFFKMLEECGTKMICDCKLKAFEWSPPDKSMAIVDCIGKELKNTMGTTLKKAFAQVHIRKPPDVKRFLSTYLIHLDQCEEFMKRKLTQFEFRK